MKVRLIIHFFSSSIYMKFTDSNKLLITTLKILTRFCIFIKILLNKRRESSEIFPNGYSIPVNLNITFNVFSQEFTYVDAKKCKICHKTEKQVRVCGEWPNRP